MILALALDELKVMMTEKIGSKDTTEVNALC
jgi:hypothetical protein